MASNNLTLIDGTQVGKIPVETDLPWYVFKIALSATLFTLRFRFNTRMNRWILDIADSQDNDLATSIPLLILRNLSGRFTQVNLPPGFFFCVDDTGQGGQPTRFAFGTTHTCWYFDTTGTTF